MIDQIRYSHRFIDTTECIIVYFQINNSLAARYIASKYNQHYNTVFKILMLRDKQEAICNLQHLNHKIQLMAEMLIKAPDQIWYEKDVGYMGGLSEL